MFKLKQPVEAFNYKYMQQITLFAWLGFVLLILAVVAAVAVLATRSIWVDEATLLTSIYHIDFSQVLQPLPFYDQASPVLPLVFTKLIALIAGTNIALFRVLLFTVNIAFAAPLLIHILKEKGVISAGCLTLTFVAVIYSIGYYFSEIKHYGFEAAAVFLFLYWFVIYIDNQEKALSARLIWIPPFVVYMGFSTLLIAPALLAYIAIDTFLAHQFKPKAWQLSIKKHLKLGIVLALACVVGYIQMKQLTLFQMGNTWSQQIYGHKGLSADISSLYIAFVEAFSLKYLYLVVLSSVLALFLNAKTIVFKLNLFFISLIMLIVVLKILGLYPVLSGRHLVWILPISMLLIALAIPALLQTKIPLFFTLALVLFAALGLMVANNVVILGKGLNGEVTSNNDLYLKLSQQPKSDVFVFVAAQASLEIDQMQHKMPHQFYGLSQSERLSSMKPLANEQAFSDWQFAQMPQTKAFLMIISHDKELDAAPASKRVLALRSTLAKNKCVYESIYSGKDVQLLNVNCH